MKADLVIQVLQTAVDHGVREFCVCAGARNAEFIMALTSQKQPWPVHYFFEERSAAFFALGRIAREGFPVAVVTTSGTAVAELLPAVIEAHYQQLPLLLLTADRPREFRGTGAPQAIDQVGIYHNYVEQCVDWQVDTAGECTAMAKRWSGQRPAHWNVCLGEPPRHQVGVPAQLVLRSESRNEEQIFQSSSTQSPPQVKRPLVVIGPLRTQTWRAEWTQRLKSWGVPLYVESLSGLAGHPDLRALSLQGGDLAISELVRQGHFESIIRVGGVPTLRLWRDLEERHRELPVLVFADTPFSGLARGVQFQGGLQDLSSVKIAPVSTEWWQQIQVADQFRYTKKMNLLKAYPDSEPAQILRLAAKMVGQNVYLGNSLPVREWDLVTSGELPCKRIFGNRGANGIDGQISSFLGWAKPDGENWAVVGDLTALYDLASLWATRHLSVGRYRIVVINNGGGQIFRNMFTQTEFLNSHSIEFSHWAKMWDWDYVRVAKGQVSELETGSMSDRTVIEVVPDAVQTEEFWKAWRA